MVNKIDTIIKSFEKYDIGKYIEKTLNFKIRIINKTFRNSDIVVSPDILEEIVYSSIMFLPEQNNPLLETKLNDCIINRLVSIIKEYNNKNIYINKSHTKDIIELISFDAQ